MIICISLQNNTWFGFFSLYYLTNPRKSWKHLFCFFPLILFMINQIINSIKNNLFLSNLSKKHSCILCNSVNTKNRIAYNRRFVHCENCGFIFALESEHNKKGMGFSGSWSGPGGGGYREYFLVKMLSNNFDFKKFLLYGTGNTPTFSKLLDKQIDVVGCDIDKEVIEFKRRKHGKNTFFGPDDLPNNKKFDGIIAVEVFEHFYKPKESFELLVRHLNPEGIICGTTNFYLGGSIEDSNNQGYMSHKGHVAYWSHESLSFLANMYGLSVEEFEMIRPGSVLPDEKFGQLWPNKRVFFIYDDNKFGEYFNQLHKINPILPIDKP